MVNVTLVCVAGVSGTFLARRIRELDPRLSVTVTSFGGLAEVSVDADVFLVAPQLVGSLSEIERIAEGRPSVVLAPEVYRSRDADPALRAVLDLIGAGKPARSHATTAPIKE
jgi:cellobiose-specific phosphotransferase system component IIB